jgi:hypothetical protein
MCIARLEELLSVISSLTSEPAFTGFSSASRVSAKGGVELWVELAAHTARVIRINTHFREVFISAPCNSGPGQPQAVQVLVHADVMIRSLLLRHKQVYRFQLHKAKLELLLQNAYNRHLASAGNYLESIGEEFPHDMFQASEHRSSKFPTTVAIPITRKENYATRLATLVLPSASTNKKRHFMMVSSILSSGTDPGKEPCLAQA